MTFYRNRTPKNYDGTEIPSKSIKDLLPKVFAKIENRYSKQPHLVIEEWNEVIGTKLASWTKPLFFRDGILTVKVKSSTLYSLLCGQEKHRLLKKLQKKFPNKMIRDIRFQSG